jgi:hypothetical protein
LSDVVFKDIQRLACSACFKSNAIQNFIRSVHNVHIHVKLIANIGYRAREKLFGGRGDMEELLKQQKVAYSFLWKVYTVKNLTFSQERQALGDIYEFGYNDDGGLK